jgi:hypothetical protein
MENVPDMECPPNAAFDGDSEKRKNRKEEMQRKRELYIRYSASVKLLKSEFDIDWVSLSISHQHSIWFLSDLDRAY